MDPQDFGFLDPDPQKYARDPRGKKSSKNCIKKLFYSPKSELMKKREIIKIPSFLNGSSSFRIKISEKNKTKYLKIIFC